MDSTIDGPHLAFHGSPNAAAQLEQIHLRRYLDLSDLFTFIGRDASSD